VRRARDALCRACDHEQGRPALAFVGDQTFNVFWTLLLAWLLFGGVLVAQPVIN